MGISVCGIGVISAIGLGCAANLESLLSNRCGIGRNNLFESSLDLPVGQVTLSNDELKGVLGLDMATTISRSALLGAIAAREAIGGVEIPRGARVGLISSTTVGGMDLSENFYRSFNTDPTSGRLRDIVGHDCTTSTEFIAQQCGITGFSATISTACSSAANAVIMGANMLECDMLDYVVVGGSDSLCRFTLCGFNSLMILDQELCRPFDRDRKGLNLGEGAGYIVLCREGAEGCLCQLSGYANANDAFHQTASSESGDGAYLAMFKALEQADLTATQLDYINLHGTGTANNDSSESAAIKRLFTTEEGETLEVNRLACSSTKGYTGHTLAASGGVEAVYSVMSLLHGVKYASLRVTTPIEGGIAPITCNEESDEIKHVMSNSFGFGGNCSSLIFSRS